jgi:hypothetical protein
MPKIVRTAGAESKPPVVIRYGCDSRNSVAILRFFQPAGMIVLEKHGLVPSDGGMPNAPSAFGAGPNRVAVAFATPGVNAIHVRLIAVAVATTEDDADRLQRAIRQDLIKVLFE